MRAGRTFVGVVPLLALVALVLALPAQAASPVVPAIAVPIAHPATTPVAGKTFEITFPVLDALTGARLTNVTSISFEPTIAGKAVKLQAAGFVAGFRAVAGVVWMSMVVPVSAKSQVLKVELTIKADGRYATRIVSYRIKEPAL